MGVEGTTRGDGVRRRGPRLGLTVLLAGLAGCGSGTKVVPLSDSEKKLSSVALAYNEAHTKLDGSSQQPKRLLPSMKSSDECAKAKTSSNQYCLDTVRSPWPTPSLI